MTRITLIDRTIAVDGRVFKVSLFYRQGEYRLSVSPASIECGMVICSLAHGWVETVHACKRRSKKQDSIAVELVTNSKLYGLAKSCWEFAGEVPENEEIDVVYEQEIQRIIDDEIHWTTSGKFSPHYLATTREPLLNRFFESNPALKTRHDQFLSQIWKEEGHEDKTFSALT